MWRDRGEEHRGVEGNEEVYMCIHCATIHMIEGRGSREGQWRGVDDTHDCYLVVQYVCNCPVYHVVNIHYLPQYYVSR